MLVWNRMRNFFPRALWVLLVCLLMAAACQPAPPELRTLTILHANDLHARFLPDDRGRGGFAHLATAIREEKRKSPGALVLHAGDLVQGAPVSSIYEGVPCYEVANALGFDAGTLGNHEFDYTWRRIADFLETAAFPIVSANVVDGAGRLVTPEPYVIREVNGVRVAVIGALMENLHVLTKENQRGDWRFLPVLPTVRKYARQARPKADLVIVLGHLFDEEEEALLREAPEVNLVVGGHDHRGQKEARQAGNRLAVRVRAYGVELGRLDLKVDVANKEIASFEWRRIPVGAETHAPDPATAELVDKWERKVSSLVDVVIGEARRGFDRDEVRGLLETAMLEATGADLAYMNDGGVRDELPAGKISVRQLWNIMPFDNVIAKGRVRGEDLPRELLARGGVDPQREYVLVTNDFVAEQWRQSAGGPRLEVQGTLDREAFLDYLKSRKALR